MEGGVTQHVDVWFEPVNLLFMFGGQQYTEGTDAANVVGFCEGARAAVVNQQQVGGHVLVKGHSLQFSLP